MCLLLIMHKSIQLNKQTFEVRNNVKSQTANISTSELFFEYYSNEINESPSVFLLFESSLDAAFAHWVYESAIYLVHFSELKLEYPNLKLLVKKNPKRSYKHLFFQALNINENDIHWIDNEEINDCTTVYTDIPINNICINTRPHCLNTMELQDKDAFKEVIIQFRNQILHNLNIIYPEEKTIEHLFFPRSKTENYAANDRIINYTMVYQLLQGKEHTIYDTINTTNLKDQIKLLVSSKNVYLDWGSSMQVNGLFCQNSNILISCSIESQMAYKWIYVFFELSKENNNQFIKIN